MRKYIQNEELSCVLSRIMSRQDPELIDIYRNVIRYRLSQKSPAARKALKMIQYPKRIGLCIFNLFLMPLISFLFLAELSLRLGPAVTFLFLGSLLLYSIYSGVLLVCLLATFSRCRGYILVDELFARKILVLQKESPVRHAKAVK